jgi:hypothetical protein
MQTKILFFISLCVLSINGCFFVVPVPSGKMSDTKIDDAKWFVSSESIENIVRDQNVPGKIRRIKGETIDIIFKDDFCACSGKGQLRMSVSEVDTRGVKGNEELFGPTLREGISYLVDNDEYQKICKPFVAAQKAIFGAIPSSGNGQYYYTESYELIWEAERALRPTECDPVRARILAEKAKQIAEDEGAKALGYDITGTWVSEITSNHPDYFNKKEQRNLKLKIDERGNQITATDSSGEATLEAYRIEGFQYPTSVKFKFSSPLVSINQFEGEWEVIDGSTIEGSWNDPITSAFGKWNLRKIGRKIRTENLRKYSPKHLQKWLSQKPPIEIKWKEIDEIDVWELEEGDVDWKGCWVSPLGGDCINIGY